MVAMEVGLRLQRGGCHGRRVGGIQLGVGGGRSGNPVGTGGLCRNHQRHHHSKVTK